MQCLPDNIDMEECQPKDLSLKANMNKKLKPIPPPLNLAPPGNTLREFAIIATSPKSPLMQKNLPFRKRAYSFSGPNDHIASPTSVACSSPSDAFERSSLSSLDEECLASPPCLPPSPAAYRCVGPATKGRVPGPPHHAAECGGARPPQPLRYAGPSALLSPAPSSPGSGSREELSPHASKLALLSPDICDRFKRFSFPPEEVCLPRSLAPPPSFISPPSSPAKKVRDAERPKRPMNAFMLFAKRYRLELIQMHPGKDNRAISVILGEAWRSLQQSDREIYVAEARSMAQEQKRLHPDCWKRKRSHSTS